LFGHPRNRNPDLYRQEKSLVKKLTSRESDWSLTCVIRPEVTILDGGTYNAHALVHHRGDVLV